MGTAVAEKVPGGPAIETSGLTKRYGGRSVVDSLDMEVPDGVVAGFIGPNGAGKTTTLRMLLGLVRPSAGSGRVLGMPLTAPARYVAAVGALIESPGFHPGLSGQRNLAIVASLAGIRDRSSIPALLERVGLGDRGHDAYRTYSLGMKQRLGIAAALIGEPALLILDEPANGLDPSGIREMRTLLRSFNDEGRTVFVSSHQLAEVQQVCDWLVVIDRGRRIFQGPTSQLVASNEALVLRSEHPADLPRLEALLGGRGLHPMRSGDRLRVQLSEMTSGRALPEDLDGLRHALAEINRAATADNITLIELTVVRAELEDRYEALVAGGAR
jgi:ABC-2 type transport system ATP-binding protein